MIDISSNIIQAISQDPYFTNFTNAGGFLKVTKDHTAMTNEKPYVVVETDFINKGHHTGRYRADVWITVYGDECHRVEMFEIAEQLRDIFRELDCLPACGNGNRYSWKNVDSIRSRSGYNPVTKNKFISLSLPVIFRELDI